MGGWQFFYCDPKKDIEGPMSKNYFWNIIYLIGNMFLGHYLQYDNLFSNKKTLENSSIY